MKSSDPGINWFRVAVTEFLYHARSSVSDIVYPDKHPGSYFRELSNNFVV
jgi:hypothetical protein